MVWLIYWPLLLVIAAAIAAGIAILVRRLRHQGDNPFIVPPPRSEDRGDGAAADKRR
jgi:hypothetical protein